MRPRLLTPKIPALISLLFVLGLLAATAAERKPNVVIMFLDDSGWADFHPFGNPPYATPNVEQLAKDGCRFNNFYVPQAVCSASRAALMTGCFPGRTKVFGAHGPKDGGLDPKFATLAEILKPAGYATGCFGKWHLGDAEGRRPLDRGFDENVGIMYSNDMWKNHPGNPKHWGKYPLIWWDNGEHKVPEVDHEHQKEFTKWITEAAVDFITRHKDEPFLCYIPHPQPHVPLYTSKAFEGKSGAGLYGDVMLELDWSMGQVVKALKDNGLEDDTIVMFTSDNGPWVSYGDHAGATPFREAKGTSFDGGCRSACIVKSPGEIKPGTTSTATWCSVDVVPTIAKLAGAKLPEGGVDGHDAWPLLTGDASFENPIPFYEQTIGGDFQGFITGDGAWKLHVPHAYRSLKAPGKNGNPGPYLQKRIGYALFDMKKDPHETVNVIEQHAEVGKRLVGLAEAHRKEFFPKKAAFEWAP